MFFSALDESSIQAPSKCLPSPTQTPCVLVLYCVSSSYGGSREPGPSLHTHRSITMHDNMPNPPPPPLGASCSCHMARRSSYLRRDENKSRQQRAEEGLREATRWTDGSVRTAGVTQCRAIRIYHVPYVCNSLLHIQSQSCSCACLGAVAKERLGSEGGHDKETTKFCI